MGELSILTIIISLAVCSLLVYGIFQYMKIRLTVLEQSHREQAMILQQYIEESSSDIHRLYKMSSAHYNGSDGAALPQGSIILEYANENETPDEKPLAYHEPHTIHLDTALFQNKRSNLIEISSDSEDTTDSETDSDDSTSSSSSSSSSSTEHCDHESESETDSENDYDTQAVLSNVNTTNELHIESVEIHESEVKTITVDLGTIQDQDTNKKSDVSPKQIDVLSLLYKKAQMTPLPDDNDLEDSVDSVITITTTTPQEPIQDIPVVPTTTPAATVNVPLSAMSVSDLKHLLKELCKNQPEKHAEIQRLKKPELIYAIKQLQQ